MLDRIGPRLLWIDGFAGLTVGIGVLLLLDRLGQWLGLPIALLRATGGNEPCVRELLDAARDPP